jgi:hypothetical protein
MDRRMAEVHARLLAVGAGMVFLGISLGCMSFTLGGRTEVVSKEEVGGLQRGKASLAPGEELVVYYPAPYASPPNLEMEDPSLFHAGRIIEQRPDGFRIKNTSSHAVELAWKARGVKASGPIMSVTPSHVAVESSPAPILQTTASVPQP